MKDLHNLEVYYANLIETWVFINRDAHHLIVFGGVNKQSVIELINNGLELKQKWNIGFIQNWDLT